MGLCIPARISAGSERKYKKIYPGSEACIEDSLI